MSEPSPVLSYEEPLTFRVYQPGTPKEHTALLPSELDIAMLNQRLEVQREEIQRLEQQLPPSDVVKARKRLDELQAPLLPERPAASGSLAAAPAPGEARAETTPEYVLAMEKVRAWEQRRMWEEEGFRTSLWRTTKQLERMLNQLEEAPPPGATEQVRTFRLRDMAYEERLLAEEKTTAVDPRTGLKDPQMPKRDLLLIRAVYLGELVDGELEKGDPGQLGATITEVLVQRMWARTLKDPNLTDYFRGGRKATGRQGEDGPRP